jgi:hypothetical protein
MPHGNGKSQNAPEPFRYTLINDAPHPMSLLNPEVSNPDLGQHPTNSTEETDSDIARKYRKRYGHHDSYDVINDTDDDLNSWG